MSADTEYLRGQYEEKNGAMVQRPMASFTPRGNDVWAARSGRQYQPGMEGGAEPDYSSPVTGNGMGNLSRLVGGKKKGGAKRATKGVSTDKAAAERAQSAFKQSEQARLEKQNQAQAERMGRMESLDELHLRGNESRAAAARERSSKTPMGRVLSALGKVGDFSTDYVIQPLTKIPGLGTLAKKAQQFNPTSKYYNPGLESGRKKKSDWAKETAMDVGSEVAKHYAEKAAKAAAAAAWQNFNRPAGPGPRFENLPNAPPRGPRAPAIMDGPRAPAIMDAPPARPAIMDIPARPAGPPVRPPPPPPREPYPFGRGGAMFSRPILRGPVSQPTGATYASPDYGVLNAMSQGQQDFMGSGKKRLTPLEKKAMEMAHEAQEMGMSLEQHLKHQKVPAAKRRTILKRAAKASGSAMPMAKGSGRTSQRGQAIARLMKEHGVSLGEASKMYASS